MNLNFEREQTVSQLKFQLQYRNRQKTIMTSASVSVEGFDSSPIFEDIQNVLKDDKIAAQIVDEFKAVYQFNIANPGNSKNQVWTLDLKVRSLRMT
jgi:hypothetical protein